MSSAPGSGHLDFSDESPFLDFDPDGDFDDSFGYDEESGRMIGDLPGDLHDKRKSIDGQDDDDEGGGKRREGEDKTAKKPGRKPLTVEPTSVSARFRFPRNIWSNKSRNARPKTALPSERFARGKRNT